MNPRQSFRALTAEMESPMTQKQESQPEVPGLRFSGERIIPGEVTRDRELASRRRYQFAAWYVEGKRVLDMGCGEGYGTAILAERAAQVVGTDASEEAIAHAAAKYRLENVAFHCMPAEELSFPNNSFDVVVCLELIEHVEHHIPVMREIQRVLRTDGTLILSTPNKSVTSPGRKKPIHEYHVREFTVGELHDLCRNFFPEVELFSQENPFEKSRRTIRWFMALDFLHLRKLFPRRSKDRVKDRMKDALGETIREEPEPQRWAVISGAKPNCRDIVVVCRKPR